MGRILSTVTRVLRKRTLRLIADSVFYSGALSLAKLPVRAQARNGPGSRGKFSPFMVLLYHRVNRERDPFFPSVSVTAFEAQMRYLARNFNVLSLNDICQRIGEGREIRPWTVAITFDDGYRDNYLYANPILKKYRLPATIFVPTGYIETGLVLWNDRIAQAIKQTQRKEIALTLNHAGCIFRLQSADDKVKFLNIVLQELKSYPESQKMSAVDAILKELQNGVQERSPMLSWSELRQMAREGWEVGSHTVNHVILTKVSGQEAYKELSVSKNVLETQLQRVVSLFAYPNGKKSDFDGVIKRIAREVGYRAASTTLNGINKVALDPFEIRRHSVWEEHLPSFATKMQLGYWRAL